MLRINSTTTRAVTAFDVVGLFCILLKCRPTASCRRSGARIIIRYVFTVKSKRCTPSKKQTKKQPRKLSPARPPFNKMQGNHPLCPHSTHYPHFVKHFLAKKNNRASFHRRGYLSKNAREPPLTPSFYPHPTQCQAHPRKKSGRACASPCRFQPALKENHPSGLLRRILPIPSNFASASSALSFHSLSNSSPCARRSYSVIKTCSANKRR